MEEVVVVLIDNLHHHNVTPIQPHTYTICTRGEDHLSKYHRYYHRSRVNLHPVQVFPSKRIVHFTSQLCWIANRLGQKQIKTFTLLKLTTKTRVYTWTRQISYPLCVGNSGRQKKCTKLTWKQNGKKKIIRTEIRKTTFADRNSRKLFNFSAISQTRFI